jgi:LysM repeat protein
MQSVRQALAGILTGVLSLALILGALLAVFAESGAIPATIPATPTETTEPFIFPTLPPLTFGSPAATFTATTPAPESGASVTPTLTPPPTSTECPPPLGWVPILIAPGDTLQIIAARYLTSDGILRTANCMQTDSLVVGSVLYVPYVPLPSATPCHPPATWIRYIVQPGDTLYHIGVMYRISVDELQRGNCMGYRTLITSGQTLYVPNVPPSTLTFTPVIPDTSTPLPTDTPVPSATTEITLPSDTPTPTDTPTPAP